MKKKFLILIFGLEILICLVLVFSRFFSSDLLFVAMTFPFEQIGLFLRVLSLSGSIGNGIAIGLYVVLCLLPGAVLFQIARKRTLHLEDGLLGVLSLFFFFVFYEMINPGFLNILPGGDSADLEKAVFGGTVYVILCAYISLRFLRLSFSADRAHLQKNIIVLLILINILFVFCIFGMGIHGLITSLESLQEGNQGNEHLLGISKIFLVGRFFVDSIPFALSIWVCFSGIHFVEVLTQFRYSEASVALSKKLSNTCKISLIVIVWTNAGFHLLQLFFLKKLHIINTSVQIPVISLVFVLAVLLLSRFITENHRLKEENDSII